MPHRRSAVLATALTAALLFTGPATAQDAGSLGPTALNQSEADDIRALILQMTSDMETRNFAGWGDYWAADGIFMPAESPRVAGRQAITGAIRGFDMGTSFEFSDWQIVGAEDLAVVTNRLELEGVRSSIGASSIAYNQVYVLRRGTSGWQVQSLIQTPTQPIN